MGLLKQTQQQYYSNKRSFTGDGTTNRFTLSNSFDTFRGFVEGNFTVHINGSLVERETTDDSGGVTTNWEFGWTNGPPSRYFVDFILGTTPADGDTITVEADPTIWQNDLGVNEEVVNYQFVSLDDIINNFMVSYTGENKIISKVKRTDVQFHAMRAMQELSFDTFKSTKSQEIEIPASLTMRLPHDYVNYVKLVWSDASGIEHVIYPASKTSNPKAIKQNDNGEYSFDIDGDGFEDTDNLISPENSDTWDKYKGTTPSESQNDYQDDTYWPAGGERYGLDPQHAQVNGSFYIDDLKGSIHFSSNISGKTVILKYISDSLGTDEEMLVHKFAEEAMYKWIAYAVLSTRANIPEYLVGRFKNERFAETRKAKLRLSNIKLEEITQVLRGKSKHIKH